MNIRVLVIAIYCVQQIQSGGDEYSSSVELVVREFESTLSNYSKQVQEIGKQARLNLGNAIFRGERLLQEIPDNNETAELRIELAINLKLFKCSREMDSGAASHESTQRRKRQAVSACELNAQNLKSFTVLNETNTKKNESLQSDIDSLTLQLTSLQSILDKPIPLTPESKTKLAAMIKDVEKALKQKRLLLKMNSDFLVQTRNVLSQLQNYKITYCTVSTTTEATTVQVTKAQENLYYYVD